MLLPPVGPLNLPVIIQLLSSWGLTPESVGPQPFLRPSRQQNFVGARQPNGDDLHQHHARNNPSGSLGRNPRRTFGEPGVAYLFIIGCGHPTLPRMCGCAIWVRHPNGRHNVGSWQEARRYSPSARAFALLKSFLLINAYLFALYSPCSMANPLLLLCPQAHTFGTVCPAWAEVIESLHRENARKVVRNTLGGFDVQ